MTYISRRTRIIVSRWTDECDADYILRAVRKRSDGRIKRYSSCDDLRAWVNDYCIKHEHLVDLMSNGEVSGPPPFRLYGRFIPVPILFKLMQKFQNNDFVNIKEQSSKKEKDNLASRRSEFKRNGNEIACKDCKKSAQSLHKNETSNVENNSILSRVQWEKNRLEKNLYDSTNLLSLALSKLEKIDNIVDFAKEETDNAKNEEIQFAYGESQAEFDNYDANQVNDGNVSDGLSSSRTYVKKIKDSAKCSKLLRKISDLREKLRRVQECRQIITRQIHMSRMNAIKHESSNQVTELYNRREECRLKKLKKKLEKLIAERGRLLSEMCEALNDLNTLKRISRSNLSQKKCSRVCDREEIFKCSLRESARCTCGCNCAASSREFDVNNTDSPSESDLKECADHIKHMCPWNTSSESPVECSRETPKPRPCLKRSSRSTGVLQRCAQDSHYSKKPETKPLRRHHVKSSPSIEQSSTPNTEVPNLESSKSSLTNQTTSYSNSTELKVKGQPSSQILKKPQTLNNKAQKSPERVKSPDKISESVKDTKNTRRSSKVNFVEKEPYCRKKYYQDDLTGYENSLTPQQQKVIQKALKKIESRRSKLVISQESEKRPTSSPTTDKERRRLSFESHRRNVQDLSQVTSPERRVKSETTMQEIEKTLRNYEQRLKKYDGLENKIEEIRRKITQVNRIKLEWERHRNEGHKELETERNRSSQEISKLSTENWALKKQIQKLMAKFEVQCRKIQTLKCNAQKNWELECETEELKKELVKYRDTFEHQRKCITKWESVVLLQRKEIENLMNHIRRLSAECSYSTESQSQNFQRSRSFSPKLPKPRTILSRANIEMKDFRSSSDDEDEPYYYSQCQQIDNSRSSHEGSFYYPDLHKRQNCDESFTRESKSREGFQMAKHFETRQNLYQE